MQTHVDILVRSRPFYPSVILTYLTYMHCYSSQHTDLGCYTREVSAILSIGHLQISVLLCALLFGQTCRSFLLYLWGFGHSSHGSSSGIFLIICIAIQARILILLVTLRTFRYLSFYSVNLFEPPTENFIQTTCVYFSILFSRRDNSYNFLLGSHIHPCVAKTSIFVC